MNDELLQLRYTKLKRKVSYLKAELEESNSIFMQALTNFQKDFGEYTEPKPVTKKEESRLKPVIEYDIPEKEIDFLFRCIAQKTHPDKLVNKDISKKQDNKKHNQINLITLYIIQGDLLPLYSFSLLYLFPFSYD